MIITAKIRHYIHWAKQKWRYRSALLLLLLLLLFMFNIGVGGTTNLWLQKVLLYCRYKTFKGLSPIGVIWKVVERYYS